MLSTRYVNCRYQSNTKTTLFQDDDDDHHHNSSSSKNNNNNKPLDFENRTQTKKCLHMKSVGEKTNMKAMFSISGALLSTFHNPRWLPS